MPDLRRIIGCSDCLVLRERIKEQDEILASAPTWDEFEAVTERANRLERRLVELQHVVQPLHADYEMLVRIGPIHEDWENLAQLMGWNEPAPAASSGDGSSHTKWSDIKAERASVQRTGEAE